MKIYDVCCLIDISVAAEDAGVVVSDLNNVHSRTRYTTCFAEEFGGSGNPSVATGKGKYICAALFNCIDQIM